MSRKKFNLFAILSIIFSFVFSPLGLIFGIVALNQIKKTKEKGKGLATFSIIWGCFVILIVITSIVWVTINGLTINIGRI